MLCDRCHAREATVHMTQIINGHKIERHLCPACSAEERVLDGSMDFMDRDWFKSPLESFFGSDRLGSFFEGFPQMEESRTREISAESPMFKTGLRGCPDSYAAFREKIRPAFEGKKHMTSENEIKTIEDSKKEIPVREGGLENGPSSKNPELDKLEKALKSCVSREDYEGAARIRDEINDLKNKDKK